MFAERTSFNFNGALSKFSPPREIENVDQTEIKCDPLYVQEKFSIMFEFDDLLPQPKVSKTS